MTARELLELKDNIAKAKNTTAELKGQQNALMKQLKEEWKCSSLEDAEKLIQKMDGEIDALNKNIEEGMKELESKYQI
jgi:DNA-binding FrmR family transcriptional regulator